MITSCVIRGVGAQLALEYLGAGLKADGHQVAILDARIDPDVEGALRAFEPDLVGVTAYTNQVNLALAIARLARSLAPSALVVAGGHHATVQPEDFNDPAIDATVIGEGVHALREIAARRASGASLDEVRGLLLPGTPPRRTPQWVLGDRQIVLLTTDEWIVVQWIIGLSR